MTAKRRGRPPGSKNKPKAAAPTRIYITGKRVQGDGRNKHLRGEVLEIGVDVTPETAAKMLEFGTAMPADGLSPDQQSEAAWEAQNRAMIAKRKQNAEQVMEQYDRQSDETREALREHERGWADDGA